MDRKLAHAANLELNSFRREQLGSLMALASLSMTGLRGKHEATNEKNDSFNVPKLTREALYKGSRHADLMTRRSNMFDTFTACNFTPILQSILKPYEAYLGVIDSNTSFHAIRFTLPNRLGQSHDYWHYSISFCDEDIYPEWLKASSLRILMLYIALKRVVNGDITQEQFVMFCSDVLSSVATLTLNKVIVEMAKP